MNTANLNACERLERLELALRRHRMISGSVYAVAILMIACAWAAAQGDAKAIKAVEFVLLDGNGKTRAVLRTEDAGPVLRFMNDKGTMKLLLEQGSISGFDDDGAKRFAMYIEPLLDTSVISLADAKSSRSMTLQTGDKRTDIIMASPGNQFMALSGGPEFSNIEVNGPAGQRILMSGGQEVANGPHVAASISLYSSADPFPSTLLHAPSVGTNAILTKFDKNGKLLFSQPKIDKP